MRRLTIALLIAATGASIAAPTASGQATGEPTELRWLAAGDSYSSGEGLPDVSEPTCQRADDADGRSSSAWAEVARSTIVDQLDGAMASDGSVVLAPGTGATGGFDFVACTGAVTEDLFDDAAGKKEWDAEQNGRFDLVTFSFGGNNVGFADTLVDCLDLDGDALARLGADLYVSGPALTTWDVLTGGCPPEDQIRSAIDGLAAGGNRDEEHDRQLRPYTDFLEDVADRVVNPGGNVVVVGYPELIEDPQFWPSFNQAANSCQGIREDDALLLRGVAGYLNQTIGAAVDEVDDRRPNGVHFSFLDINTGGNGVAADDPNLYEPSSGDRHNLCAADPWLNGIATTGLTAGDLDLSFRRVFTRSFHPTQDGHDATGQLLVDRLRELDWSDLEQPPPPGTTGVIGDVTRLDGYMVDIGAAGNAAWVTDSGGMTSFGRVRRIGLDGGVDAILHVHRLGSPNAMAVAPSGVWVAEDFGRVLRLPPGLGGIEATVRTDPGYDLPRYELAADRRMAWSYNHYSGRLRQIRAGGSAVVRTVDTDLDGDDLELTADSLWVLEDFDVVRLDPRTGEELGRVAIPEDGGGTAQVMAANNDGVWITRLDGHVVHVDADTSAVTDILVDDLNSVGDVAVTPTDVWVTTGSHTVVRIDPVTDEITTTIPIPERFPDDYGSLGYLAATESAVWVLDAAVAEADVIRIDLT